MDQKFLIVLSIISGRNFPKRPDSYLIVEAQFNKEILSTDPIPHVGGILPISTELAWELSRKALQQHKLNRTPIKLQCFAVSKITKLKENIGYVMLDLRTAQLYSDKDPAWHGILNSPYSRPKPQLCISLSLESEGVSSSLSEGYVNSSKTKDLELTLDPSGVFYQLGPVGVARQDMYMLSLTLQNAQDLPDLPSGKSHFYFFYTLLGNDITSEPFAPPTFPPERASVRIRSTRQVLGFLMASQQDMHIHLCCGSESLSKGCLSLTPLKTVDRIDCTLPLEGLSNHPNASIDIILQLEKAPPLSAMKVPPASPPPHAPPIPSPHQERREEGVQGGTSQDKGGGQGGEKSVARSAKRNLTQSFEDAYQATPAGSSEKVGNEHSPTSPSGHTHKATPTSTAKYPRSSVSTSTTTMQPRPLPTSVDLAYQPPRLQPAADNSAYPKVPLPSLVVTSSAGSQFPPPTPPLGARGQTDIAQASVVPLDESHSGTRSHMNVPEMPLDKSHSGTRSQINVPEMPLDKSHSGMRNQTNVPLSSAVQSEKFHSTVNGLYHPPLVTMSPTMGAKGQFGMRMSPTIAKSEASRAMTSSAAVLRGGEGLLSSSQRRHYRFSIDLRSLQNVVLEAGIKCYLKYNYSFFGCPYPVVVQPPVTVAPNSELRFSQSFCSFDFASSYRQLLDHTSHQPLTVEVWQSCDQSHDQLVGISQVPLVIVLSQEKLLLGVGTSTRQVFNMQAHVTPPTSTLAYPVTVSLGKLNVALVLEDLGPISFNSDENPDAKTGALSTAGFELGGVNKTLHQFTPLVPCDDTGEDTDLGRKTSVKDHVASVQEHMVSMKDRMNAMQSHVTDPGRSHDRQDGVVMDPGGRSPGSGGRSRDRQDGVVRREGLGPTGDIKASLEYKVAMELEMWKLEEEESFKEELQKREAAHMTQLGEEFRRREEQRQHLLRQKLEHYGSLEKELQEGLEKLHTQQQILQEREMKLSQERDRVSLEQSSIKAAHSREIVTLKTQHTQRLEMERLKCSQLEAQVDSLRKQVKELEVKVRSRETEYEKFRHEATLRPESKLQAELSVAELEKAELERKLSSAIKSKQHYKDQWTKALSELATSRQKDQADARSRLLTQQQELEALRVQYFQQEQQNSIRQQLSLVKKDVNSLQEHTLTLNAPHPSTKDLGRDNHTPTSPSLLPSSSHAPSSPRPPKRSTNPLNEDVARWIEERDILLQTGVYSGTDPTIQKLDSKIRAAMLQLKDM